MVQQELITQAVTALKLADEALNMAKRAHIQAESAIRQAQQMEEQWNLMKIRLGHSSPGGSST